VDRAPSRASTWRYGPHRRVPFVAGVVLGSLAILVAPFLALLVGLASGPLAVIGWFGCLLASVILPSASARWLLRGVLASSIATGIASVLASVARLASEVGLD
jgi:hypothetical protein